MLTLTAWTPDACCRTPLQRQVISINGTHNLKSNPKVSLELEVQLQFDLFLLLTVPFQCQFLVSPTLIRSSLSTACLFLRMWR